jgi:hypothetical protein
MASFYARNTLPAVEPTAGYVGIDEQLFGDVRPQARGLPVAIPVNTMGNIRQQTFSKVNSRLTLGKPLAKIIIATQQARF